MLADSKKKLIYLENQKKIWQRKILKAKGLLSLSLDGKNSFSLDEWLEKDRNFFSLEENDVVLWEVLSDFSYDISTLNDNQEILSYLFFRFNSFIPLDYIQLTLQNNQNPDLWTVYFLKTNEKENFVISKKEYNSQKIKPSYKLTFHQDSSQSIQSFVAIPINHLGEHKGVLGFASKEFFNWEKLSENFYSQLAKILGRRVYANVLLETKETLNLKFIEFAEEVLEPYKNKAANQGIKLGYSFAGEILKKERPYVAGELEQWLHLLAKDLLERKNEPVLHVHFYEKGGMPSAQILSIGSPKLLSEELASYLKERDSFPTIERKREAYLVDIPFK